ncbi:MAG TPA: M23 family metallopeptidase [Chryseosolibacter sp.]
MKNLVLLFSGILVIACNGLRSMKTVFDPVSPYDEYAESLKKAGLSNASMAKEWFAAGQRVFNDSVSVPMPFSESGYFTASAAEARSYRFKAQEGQLLTVRGVLKSKRDAKIFLDVFIRDGQEWERLASADSTSVIAHEFTSDEECVVRLQPELLVNGYYTISISLTPVLINPVYGATNRSIGSFYGAPRDEGKRLHEGVDIFAKRGTAVLAPADGYITRVGVSKLGGKVVWMRDSRRDHSYYFAHLDSQMVKPGMRVFKGYVLGLVGNTGNARNTASHLHFGIYRYGSKDPLGFIRAFDTIDTPLQVDTAFHRQALKVRRAEIRLMAGPSGRSMVKASLLKDTYVTVIGESHGWYRIALPDDRQGYVMKKNLIALRGGNVIRLDSTRVLLSEIRLDAIPITTLRANSSVEVLARFDNFEFVRTEKGKAGWLYN